MRAYEAGIGRFPVRLWDSAVKCCNFYGFNTIDLTFVISDNFRLTLCSVQPQAEVRLPGETEKERQNARPLLIDESWPEQIKEFFMHLRELGLIFIRKRKDG